MCSPIAMKEAGRKQEAADISSNDDENDLGSEKGKRIEYYSSSSSSDSIKHVQTPLLWIQVKT